MYSCPKPAPPTNLIPPSLIEGGSGTRVGRGEGRDKMRSGEEHEETLLV